MIGRSCETCEWWDRFLGSSAEYGLCRGGPPTVMDNGSQARWPVTAFGAWCGTFRLREALCGGKDSRDRKDPAI